MLKGFWLCLKRFPKPELIIFGCIAGLVIAFGKAVDHYVTEKAVEVFDHTSSLSRENLEIVLCPMPRVYVLRLTHFGQSLPKYFNKLLFEGLVMPFMDELERKVRIKYPRVFRGPLRRGSIRCLLDRRQYKPTDMLPTLLTRMRMWGRCQVRSIFWLPLYKAFRDGDKFKAYLDEYFGTLDERLLEEYPGLLDQAWVLPYDNLTIEQMFDYVGVNLNRYIDEVVLRKSVLDIKGPRQTLEESVLDTRMAPNCFRHVFRNNDDNGYQRSKVVYQFRKNCPKEPENSLIGNSPCLNTADMYITMYITAYNQFTDVPAASVIVPYRVAADKNSVVHLSAQKRLHEKNCKDYDPEESQVTCVEDCLYDKMTLKNDTGNLHSKEGKMRCRVPWIDRLKKRSNDTAELPLCHTREELKTTIKTIQEVFDITEASECSLRCPRHCHELTITPRLSGSAHISRDRGARIPRHPRLEVLISDTLPVFTEMQQYDFGKMIAEMLGSLSFLIGVSLVALYDWLIGFVLWMVGKLPFIPAMPPVIKEELYTSEICSCAETEEERRNSLKDTMDDSETYLAASFKHHRRSSMMRSFNPHGGGHEQRRRAMTLNFPSIEVKSSVMDTLARTFQPAESSDGQLAARRSSLGQSGRRSSHTLPPGDGEAGRASESVQSSGQYHDSWESSLVEAPKLARLFNVQLKRSSVEALSDAQEGRQGERKTRQKRSHQRVAPEDTGDAEDEEEEEEEEWEDVQEEEEDEEEGKEEAVVPPPTSRGLPDITTHSTARPTLAVKFDLSDVEKVLEPSASSEGQTVLDPTSESGGPLHQVMYRPPAAQSYSDRPEQRVRGKLVSQYRSRPLRRKASAPRASAPGSADEQEG